MWIKPHLALTDIGFNFPFGDGTYSQFWTNPNGILCFNNDPSTAFWLQFASGQAYSNQPKICGISKNMWTGKDGYVKYELTGTAPNRVLVCEFFLHKYVNYAANTKWQVQLHEANAKVIIVYGDTPSSYFGEFEFQIGLSQSGDDIWTINPSTHEATHSTGAVETTYTSWPGVNRYYQFNPPLPPFTDNGDGTYTINTAAGWGMFCDMLDGDESFSGKTVKLGADITVSRMAGSGTGGDLTTSDHPFCGTFDGQGHTLTFNYGSSGSPADENNLAPFRYINNATIQHLHVAGTIHTQHVHAGGIVGMAYSSENLSTTITDCRSSVNIISKINGDGTHGGIMSCSWTGSTTNIDGCLFDGSIQSATGYTTNQCGGFVGWRNATINVSNCLLTANLSTIATPSGLTYPSATFVRNGNANTITNCYYVTAFGIVQGKQRHSITAGQNVTSVANAGTPEIVYNTSGITSYGTGIKYNNVLYAGNDDAVSLTLSHSEAPTGYTFTGYTANAGTLNGTTLTMPNEDVIISATMTANSYTVHFDGNGNTGGSMSDQTFTYGVAQNLTANAFTLTGYHFNGWNTQANGGGTSYTDGQEVSNLTATNNGTVTLYAQWTANTYTVQFNGNGNTGGSMSDQTFTYDVAQNLTANAFTRTNYTFAGWNTQANGGGTSYTDGQEVINLTATNNGTVTLYAQWESIAVSYLDADGVQRQCTNYTLLTGNVNNLGTGGQETWYVADGNVTFSNTINVAYGNVHIILKDNAVMNVGTEQSPISEKGIYVYYYKSLNIYAQSTGADKGQLNVYATDYGIYANNGALNINGGQVTANGNNYGIYAYSYSNITINGGQVTATGGSGIFANYYSTVTISGGQVTATGNNRGLWASQNSTLTISGGQVTATGNGNNSYGILSNNGTLTISGGQVTANGNGDYSYGITTFYRAITLGWTNPTDFIYANSYHTYESTINIAEGKAFITDDGNTYTSGALTSEQLAALAGKTLYPEGVVFKEVAGYGEGSGGWVFIASPVAGSIAPTDVHNLVATPAADFDLYYFDQTREKEWVNYKDNESHTNVDPGFNLVSGKGYLYATKYTKKLAFGGTFITNNEPVAVPLVYTANAQCAGWNLVGNPFTTSATMTDGQGQPKSYYVISGQTVVPYDGSATTIEPFTGVMVKAEGTGESVYFTKVSSNAAPQPNNGSLHIALTEVVEPVETPARDGNGLKVGPSTLRQAQGPTLLDNAIVSFNEGSQLGKFYFGEQNANLYLPQGAEEYAIVSVGNAGEMPVNFKAKENGTYTIAVNPEGVEMIYLHLIDNMTGADIDLLAMPSYTFTARTTDYESRFKLVFCTGVNDDSDNFAFISNGNIIVNGEGTLQIIDVMGRVIVSRDGVHTVSTNGMTAGVYVLRLINGDDVKVQKIVVE